MYRPYKPAPALRPNARPAPVTPCKAADLYP